MHEPGKSLPLPENPDPAVNLPTRQESYSTLLDAVVRSSNDAIITKNLDGIITSWNPAATAIFGYEPEEIIGRSVFELIPPRLHHEGHEILRRLRAGEQIFHLETTRLHKNGEEILVSLTISPLRDASGAVVGASKVARNVTRSSHLERSRLLLAAIVESSDDAIISKSLDGIILSWNAAAERLFGYAAHEIVGHSILALIPPELRHEEPSIIARLSAGERIEHFETIRLRKDGQPLEVSLTISPIRSDNGTVIGASKILRDISDRKRLQGSLLQAEKIAATGRMAASIAHEINNPLEGLLNLIYLARISADDPIQVRSLLLTAEDELERVAHIAKQTLGYYRENVSATMIPFADIARDVLNVYGPTLHSSGIRIHTDFQPVPSLTVKRGEIMQVLSNLVANASHAMPDGGDLFLSLRRDGSSLQFDIRDTGTGIAAENLTRIFEPFFTTRAAVGTGIGLWVARQFIESRGGTITAQSSTQADSHGTTMSIRLPLKA